MADLFSVTSPLMIKSPRGGEKVIAEIFPYQTGIVFFEIFWNQIADDQGIHIIEGEIQGDGPWRIGSYIINLLGCHGTNQQLAMDFSQWQMYLQTPVNDYPDHLFIQDLARRFTQI